MKLKINTNLNNVQSEVVDKSAKKLSFIIAFHYLAITFKNIVVSLNPIILKYNSILNMLLIGITIIGYFCYLISNLKRIYFLKQQLGLMFFLILFIIFSFLFNGENFLNNNVLEQLRTFLAYSLPVIIFLPTLSRTDYIIDYFHKGSNLLFYPTFFFLVYFILKKYNSLMDDYYSMSFGLNASMLALFTMSNFFKKKRIIYLIQTVILTLSIVFYASRYPLLIILFYFIYKLLTINNKKMKFLVLFWGVFVTVILLFNFETIIVFLINIVNRLGLNSRTLNQLLSGTIFGTSGRDEIHDFLLSMIYQKPIFGYGAFGGVIALNSMNTTPHSLFLDIFANFGLIFGSAFLIFGIVYSFLIFKNANQNEKNFAMILVAMFVPIMFIQFSIWTAYKMWFFISFLFIIEKKGILKKAPRFF